MTPPSRPSSRHDPESAGVSCYSTRDPRTATHRRVGQDPMHGIGARHHVDLRGSRFIFGPGGRRLWGPASVKDDGRHRRYPGGRFTRNGDISRCTPYHRGGSDERTPRAARSGGCGPLGPVAPGSPGELEDAAELRVRERHRVRAHAAARRVGDHGRDVGGSSCRRSRGPGCPAAPPEPQSVHEALGSRRRPGLRVSAVTSWPTTGACQARPSA